jgi:hypothetical protein
MAGQPMENALSERQWVEGPFAPLQPARSFGELRLGRPAFWRRRTARQRGHSEMKERGSLAATSPVSPNVGFRQPARPR